MKASVIPADEAIDAARLNAMEADVARRFVTTIRAHHTALCQWLPFTTDEDLRDHALALRLKMEHVMREEQVEPATPWRVSVEAA